MQDETTRPTHRGCAGCSALVPMKDPQRRSWCEICAPLAPELLAIARTGRVLRDKYGFADAALAIDSALGTIREGLRTGNGPARHRAAQQLEHRAERAREELRYRAEVDAIVARKVQPLEDEVVDREPGVIISLDGWRSHSPS